MINKVEKATPSDYAMLLRPFITEKSSNMGNEGNTVVFEVPKTATKTDIKGAVERVFAVSVQSIRTVNYLGKVKRTMRSIGRRAGYKKAFITLKTGQKISLIEGI